MKPALGVLFLEKSSPSLLSLLLKTAMPLHINSEIIVTIEKPVAGGRMLARHEGQIVFVAGAIPGERVRARIARVSKQVAFADTVGVLDASSDRRAVDADWACGGSHYAHVLYERQLRLKSEVIE